MRTSPRRKCLELNVQIETSACYRRGGGKGKHERVFRGYSGAARGGRPCGREGWGGLFRGHPDPEVRELPAEARDLGQLLIVEVTELGHETAGQDQELLVLERAREIHAAH